MILCFANKSKENNYPLLALALVFGSDFEKLT
jgi:hypothetical protein